MGDIMPHSLIQQLASAHSDDPGEISGGYDWILHNVKELISMPDLAFVNLARILHECKNQRIAGSC